MLSIAREALSGPEKRLARLHPAHLSTVARAKMQQLEHSLLWAMGRRAKVAGDALAGTTRRLDACCPIHRFDLASQQIDAAARQLEAMSHRSVLGRGFSVTRGPDGRILRSTTQTCDGQTINTELSDGKIISVVGPSGIRRKKKPPPADGQTLFD
jgi:exonuclease VII large subunit